MLSDALASTDAPEPIYPAGHSLRRLVRPTFDSLRRSLAGKFVSAIWVDSILLAIVGAGNFMTNYENFLLLLLYLFIPWTAINLTDYYFVRQGRYDIDAFFDPKGVYARDPQHAVYGGIAWLAMAAYVVGFLVEVPFINTTIYQGFFVKDLGGADVSWIVGLIVSAGLYYFLAMRGRFRLTEDMPGVTPVPGH